MSKLHKIDLDNTPRVLYPKSLVWVRRMYFTEYYAWYSVLGSLGEPMLSKAEGATADDLSKLGGRVTNRRESSKAVAKFSDRTICLSGSASGIYELER